MDTGTRSFLVSNRAASLALVLVAAASLAGQSPDAKQIQAVSQNASAQTKEARLVAADAKAAAMNITSKYQRGLVLEEIGAAQAEAGDLDAAVETARQAYPNTFAILKAIGEQLANSNDSGEVESILLKLKLGHSPTLLAFLAQGQAQKGNIDVALRTTEQIQDRGVRFDALRWIAERQAATGDYSGARKTFELARAANPSEHSSPDEVEILIAKGQTSRGDIQGALATISSMKSSGMKVTALASVAEKLSNTADKVSAIAFLEDVMRDSPEGRDGDILRYVAIPLQVKLGQKDRAMQVAGVLRVDLRLKGYAAVGVACAEAKDIACVDAALARIDPKTSFVRENSDFQAHQLILNVTAALLDHGEFEAGSRWLTLVEQHPDVRYTEPEVKLQRVFALAQNGEFDAARSLALKIRPSSMDEGERGAAFRTIALLQTKKDGAASAKQWASALADSEDRAYSLLGIAQGLLGIGDATLPYPTLWIH